MAEPAPRMSKAIGIPLAAAAIIGGIGAAKVAPGLFGGHPVETLWWALMIAGLGVALILAVVARR